MVAVYDRGKEQLYVNGAFFPSIVVQDGLSLIARLLGIDAGIHWQRALVVILLIGGR